VGFWRRAIALGLIDFIVLWYVFVVIALFSTYLGTGPDDVWVLGEQDPAEQHFPYYVAEGDCQPNVLRPACAYYSDWDAADTANTMWRTSVIVWAAAVFLHLWMGNAAGQTIGKGLTGARVIRRESGQSLGAGRGLLRTLGYIFSLVPFGLGFLWAIWDKDKQTWHDKIAGSVVVRGEGSGCLFLLLWLVVGIFGVIVGAAVASAS
jgi:uncharacterized RDD family membrane protein YckC